VTVTGAQIWGLAKAVGTTFFGPVAVALVVFAYSVQIQKTDTVNARLTAIEHDLITVNDTINLKLADAYPRREAVLADQEHAAREQELDRRITRIESSGVDDVPRDKSKAR